MRTSINSFLILVLLLANTNADVIEPSNVVMIVLSQPEGYYAAHADNLEKGIYEQASVLDKEPPKVLLAHKVFQTFRGSWTITPLLIYLSETFPNAKWFFFCLENTVIRLEKLLHLLEKFNSFQDIWIGHALYDHEPTIIHHFAEHNKKFKYPHIASGFAITSILLKSLSRHSDGNGSRIDFSIDASYEFANFVLSNTKTRLTHTSKLCIVSASDCATYPRFFHPCSSSISLKKVYFAVKTCAKYHTDRIPVIKSTWAKHVENIGYFSDVADRNLREAYVVPNTTKGHCAKTYAILQEASKILRKNHFNWLIISDDDTIFSVSRLLRLLTCYNPSKHVAIGERYGFRIWDKYLGYEYLTGGAGVILSTPLVHTIVKSDECECPSATTPDDMYLFGVCLSRLGIKPVHSPMFHQARPMDYPTASLASQEPISFHKFWMLEPTDMYNEWFAEADSGLLKPPKHTEL